MLQGWWTNEFGPDAGVEYSNRSYWVCTENWPGQNYPIGLDAYNQSGGFSNGYVPLFIVVGKDNKVFYDDNGSDFRAALRLAIDEFPLEGVYVNAAIGNKFYFQGHSEDINVSGVFIDAEGDEVTITLESNSNPTAVGATLVGNTLSLVVSATETGSSTIVIKGEDLVNAESAICEFTVTIDTDAPVISELLGNTQAVNNDMIIKINIDDPNTIDYVQCEYTIDGTPTTIEMSPVAKKDNRVFADAKSTGAISTKGSKLLTQYTCSIPAQANPTVGTLKILAADIGGNSTESEVYNIEWMFALIYEGFEGSTWPPDGWQLKHDTAINGMNLADPAGLTWVHCDESTFGDTKYMHSGEYSTAIGYTAPDFNWMITPEVTFDGDYELKFWMWYYNNVGSGWITKFHVLVKTTRDWDAVLSVSTAGDAINEYDTQMIVDLSAYNGATGHIAFVYEYNDGYQFAFDDVELVPTTGIEEGVTPKTTTLYQNYPNPFNPTTEISFSIESKGAVKLNVYNYTGQLVNSLVDGQMNSGLHKVNFNASTLSAGVYYYTLEADNTSITRKMVLVK